MAFWKRLSLNALLAFALTMAVYFLLAYALAGASQGRLMGLDEHAMVKPAFGTFFMLFMANFGRVALDMGISTLICTAGGTVYLMCRAPLSTTKISAARS